MTMPAAAAFFALALAVGSPSPSSSTAAAAKPEAKGGYQGHGAESVSPEVLARFRAPPVPADVARRVQAMLDVRAPSPGTLSPDGKRMFFSWSVTGTNQVWRLDGPMSFPAQLTGGEDVTSVFDVTADGKTLVLVRDRKGEENPGIYLQSADGGPLTAVQHIAKVQSQPLFVTDDGKHLYFRSNHLAQDAYEISRYAFATKAIEPVFTHPAQPSTPLGPTKLWSAADRRDAAQTLLLVHELGSDQAEIFEYDEKARALTPIVGQGEREDYVVGYGAGDDILVLTNRPSDFRRLYLFDRKARALTPISPELKWDVESFTVDAARSRIFVSVNEAGRSRPLLFDAKTKQPLPLPKLPAGDHVRLGPAGRAADKAIASVDPGTAPSQSFVVDLARGALVKWHEPAAPEVNLATFVPVAIEEYPARDGTKIPMLVRRPAMCAAAASPCPVIVELHGGPEGQARAGFNARAQLFVDAGFVFVQPNVRGSDGYGKAWVHADDGAKRKAIITDIEDAALFIKKAWAKGGKAPKIGVTGGSYGGYSSMMGMTYFAGAFDAGIQFVGISNLVSFLENTAPYRRALRISEYGDPVADRAVLTELSPVTHVGKTKGPMLMLQGASDPRVPVGEAVQMYEAMQQKKLAAELIIFPDEGHGVRKRENQVVLFGHSLAFFERHLK